MVASRCPQRFFLAAFISRSTSASVRYSRVRNSLFGGRLGLTVRFTVAGATSLRCRLAMRCTLLPNDYSYNAHFTNSRQRGPRPIPTKADGCTTSLRIAGSVLGNEARSEIPSGYEFVLDYFIQKISI